VVQISFLLRVIFGVLRHWNNEIYITPEIMKEQDPRYLVIRKLELEKSAKEEIKDSFEPQIEGSLKNKLIDIIKSSESEGGVNIETLSVKLENSPDINQELQKLLEEGMIFEPRPGIVRWLG